MHSSYDSNLNMVLEIEQTIYAILCIRHLPFCKIIELLTVV